MHLLLLYIDVLALPFFRSPHDCCSRLRGPPLAFFPIPLMIPSSCSLRCALCIALLPPLRCCATRSSGGCGLLRFRVDLPTRTSRLCGCYQEARWEVGDGRTTESKGVSGRWGGARKHGQRGRAQACFHFLPPLPWRQWEGCAEGSWERESGSASETHALELTVSEQKLQAAPPAPLAAPLRLARASSNTSGRRASSTGKHSLLLYNHAHPRNQLPTAQRTSLVSADSSRSCTTRSSTPATGPKTCANRLSLPPSSTMRTSRCTTSAAAPAFPPLA